MILKNTIFRLVLLIRIFRSFLDNALRWMPHVLTDNKSTLVQVMAWRRLAISYYLSQCWSRSMSSYVDTRPKWVTLASGVMVTYTFKNEPTCIHLHNHGIYFYGHYNDVIMGMMPPQITSLTSVYSTVYSGADQSKHQSSASLAFVWGIHRGPVNSPNQWPVTRKIFPFDDVIMCAIMISSNCSPLQSLISNLRHVQYLQRVCAPPLHIVQTTSITSPKDVPNRRCLCFNYVHWYFLW